MKRASGVGFVAHDGEGAPTVGVGQGAEGGVEVERGGMITWRSQASHGRHVSGFRADGGTKPYAQTR